MDTVIEGFVYGELSPLASGQVSSDAYEQSARELLNMVPDPRGPAVSRAGMKLKAVINAEVCRIFGFHKSPTESFICAFSPNSLEIIPSIAAHLGPNLVVNGDFTAGEVGWNLKATGLASYAVETRQVTLTPGLVAGETVEMRQSFIIPDAAANYTFNITGLFRGVTDSEAVNVKLGSTFGGHDLANVLLKSDYTFQSIAFNNPAVTTIYVTITALDWAGQSNNDTSSYVEDIRVELVPPSTITLHKTMVAPYAASEVKKLTAVRRPNADKLIILHPNHIPHEIDVSDLGVWTITPITFVAMPTDWTAGNFPTTAAFFQGRSVWAGFKNAPETFIFSKSAGYYDLTQGINADDSFTFSIDRVGEIRWILGTKSLLIGTENSEYKVVPTDSDHVIKPGHMLIELQSSHGAGEVLPVLVGVETAFVSVDARAVRAMAYYWEDDGWVAEELSQGSEHITYPAIDELDVAINPEPVLWLTLESGMLAACSYQYKKGGSSAAKRVTGWHKHRFHWPVESLAVVQEYGHSIPWVALKALVNGKFEIHIGPLDVNAAQYLDDSLYQTYNTPVTEVTGLEHLEGIEVEVLSDEATHAKKTVVGGKITLDEPAQRVDVGLPFLARLVTQPVAIVTRDGSFRHQLGRWNEMFVYLESSAFPLIDGVRAEEHKAGTRMGKAQRLYSGYVNSTQLGWNRDSVITVEQDLPFPLTVIHIAGKVDKI